jgi:hypothetical protein
MADSRTVILSLETVREYLRPPGDSTKLQSIIDAALTDMEEAARLERIPKSVTIVIDPELS